MQFPNQWQVFFVDFGKIILWHCVIFLSLLFSCENPLPSRRIHFSMDFDPLAKIEAATS